MGSVGFGEIALIAIVALLVFGPDRLPELSRKAGELLAKAREATQDFTDAIDSEFDDVSAPIRSLKAEYEATKDELTSVAGSVFDLDTVIEPAKRAARPSAGAAPSEEPHQEESE